ncbi:hypothetical protein AB0F46_35435 [Streptomyces sp. NPDC026665]|uniref:hypothetical protein n=1 Tax=Streptomyces sp. NPDC026665 TaxID=3154798 RepID=UPI0034010192
MLETVFTMFSIAFQALGLATAAVGMFKTFKDSSTPGDRFFSRVLATELGAIRQVWTAAGDLCRRLFRRPRPPTAHTGAAGVMFGAVEFSARGIVQFGPLPDPAQDTDAFKAAVEERLNRAFKLAQEVQHGLGQETKAREEEDQKMGSNLHARIIALDEESKRATIRGLHEQVLGFFCVAIGLVVQSYLDLAY